MKKLNQDNLKILSELKEKKGINELLLPIMYSYKEKRDSNFKSKEEEQLQKEKVRKIREDSIENIDRLKQRAIENLSKSGIKVIEAKDSKQAQEEIKKIIGDENLIVKSKSNTFNEISLKDSLKNKEIIETDVGDFICTLCNEKEIHPVLPSVHLTPKKISECLNTNFQENIGPVPEEIIVFLRKHIRDKITSSKIGITGANVITADGSIVILENEGNISLVSRIPEKHIIIAGFDKIVETKEDALHIVKCAANYGTGQNYPMYVNIISGPSKTADIQNKLITGVQGSREIYLILLDNGRTEILNSEFKELLYCINCGACVNFCPVFHQLINSYGSNNFPGAKGIITSYFIDGKKSAFENGTFFCTGCKMCHENCPVSIDLSDLINKLRQRLVNEGIEPENNRDMIKNVKEFGNPFGKFEDNETKIPDKLYCC